MNENLIFVDGTASGFTEESLTGQSIYLIRTTSGGTDGYVRCNGKNYMKGEAKCKFLKVSGQTLTAEEKAQACANIGWLNETVNITVTGLESGVTPVLTVRCDEKKTYLRNDTHWTIEIPMYADYTITCGDIFGYATPSPMSLYSGRATTRNLTFNYNLLP